MSYTRDPRDYKYGTTSENVRELQEKLIDAGHDIKADGVFGEKTRKAILTFEQDLTLSNSTSFCVDRVTMEYLFNGGVLTPPKPPEPSIGVPKGKGMFVRSWKHCESPEALRERVRSAGLGWVCILRLWQHEDEDDNLANGSGWDGHGLDEFLAVLKDENCDLWIWGWPLPGREEEFVAQMDNTAQDWGALGIILDCEGPWQGHSAKKLMDLSLATGYTIGVTSYGAPWFHPGLPMDDWARADFGIPQIYESEGTWDQEYPEESVNTWQQAGFRHVVPASSAFGTETHMESLLRRTPTPEGSIVWWDWYNAGLQPYRWEVVSEYEITQTA